MKILILGARGMLGRDLVDIHAGNNNIILWDLAEIDITREEETLEKILRLRPQTIINCAAYTNVDSCETEQEKAFHVNADGARHVALASAAVKARLVHLSTDYVFDGAAATPYRENATPNPINTYGRSKLQGEIYIREIGGTYLIVRTAWLYGRHGRNFVEAILRQAAGGKEIRVVRDQMGPPTFTRDLGHALQDLVKSGETGIFHVTNSGGCTWYEFALEILRQKGFGHIKIFPISSEELGRPARRPAYSRLDCSRYEQVSGKTMRPWPEALRDYFRLQPTP